MKKRNALFGLLCGVAVSFGALTSCKEKTKLPDSESEGPGEQVTEATVLERLQSLSVSENYTVVVSAEVETSGIDEDTMERIPQTTYLDRIIEYTSISYNYQEQITRESGNPEVQHTVILDRTLVNEESNGVSLLFPQPSGKVGGFSAPADVISSYKDLAPTFEGILVSKDEEALQPLLKPSYTFDIAIDQTGRPNNVIDILNMITFAEVAHLNLYVDIVNDLTLTATDKGLIAEFVFENTDPETMADFPVRGIAEMKITEGTAKDMTQTQADVEADPFPVPEENADWNTLHSLVTENTYSLSVNIPADPTHPAITSTLWYGTNYFALTEGLTEDPSQLTLAMLFRDREGSVEQWELTPVDETKPDLGTEFKLTDVVSKAEMDEYGFTSIDYIKGIPEQILNSSFAYLETLPEFNPIFKYTTRPSEPIFQGLPDGIVFEDICDLLGINFNSDYNFAEVPLSYVNPFYIAYTAILWDQGDASTIADDTLQTAVIQKSMSGGISQPFGNFGVECPLYALTDAPATGE